MHPQNQMSEAISNYYFNQSLPPFPSLRTYYPLEKENIPNIRNQSILKKQMSPLSAFKQPLQQAITNINIQRPINVFNHYPLLKAASHKEIINGYSSVKALLNDKRRDSSVSHKKSVKFVDRPEDIAQQSICLKTSRPRSSSILKSRSLSRDSYQLKETIKLKQAQETAIDYKNLRIREKYKQILSGLGREVKFRVTSSFNLQGLRPYSSLKYNSKYIDPSFPPLQQSLSKINRFPNISWKRISEMHSQPQIVRRKADQISSMEIKGQTLESKNLSFLLNLIKDSSNLLDFIFEDLQFVQRGAYIIKIFQQSQWKYIIIDDFVPVDQKSSVSAFLRIQRNHKSQIWPFLLQKAYASYLGSYEALYQISLQLLITDLLRLPLQTYKTDEKSVARFMSYSRPKLSNLLLFAQLRHPIKDTQVYKCLKITKNQQKLEFFQQNQDSSFEKIEEAEFTKKYKMIYAITVPSFQNCSSTEVLNTDTIGRQIKAKYDKGLFGPLDVSFQQIVSKMTIRSFKVTNKDQYSFIVKNQNRSSSRKVNGWSRVLLFQKQLDGFRWIAGKYSNTIISFSCGLQPGSYYLILLPDWSQQSSHTFIITSYGNNSSIRFNLEPQICIPNIIEKGCTDLAQRVGKMTQINKWICTYSFVNTDAAIIIENVNNQRRNGNIKILRTLSNLKTKNCLLLPLNRQFYAQNTGRQKQQAQIVIPKQESASVVLLFFGGFDEQFLKNFNFGL